MAFANSAIMNVLADILLYPRASNNAKVYSTTLKAALFNNSVAPDNTVVAASAAFNAGTWLTTNEVTDVTNWVSGGRAIGTPSSPPSGGYSAQNYVMLDAADTAGGGNVTIANAYGDFVYDPSTSNPVTGLGLCYHYYGGSAQGVTAGTFTVVWNVSGIMRWTHTPA